PLKARGQVLGVINVNNSTTTKVFTEEDQELLMLFANHAAIALENSHLYGELEKLAITDGLTGLANHRAFQERLVRELSRAQRFQQEVSLLIIDIDHFKSINDRHGHQVGDQVLRSVADALQDQLRKMDYVARYGGEEFAVIMPQTRKTESVRIAERLRERMANERFVKVDPTRSVTISVGVSEYPSDAREASQLVERADRALYFSKENGRNRVTPAGMDLSVATGA
ncbi:MAG: sensor domain-containing diguanylate cyclase, partial [Candidatus Omnitrophica bacterium]|nr:sensor domain-containing diguanylate cyclase [Candidatus Omnitrophota bacterium]